MSDPDFASVDYLYSFDGADGDTTFTDLKGNTTASGTGGIALSNAQSKWGTTSLDLDGTDDFLEITGAQDLPGDFTIEFWWQPKLSLQTGYIFDLLPPAYGASWPVSRIQTDTNGNVIYEYAGSIITGSLIATAAQWYHIAGVRESGTHRLYVDGNQEGGTLSNAASVGSFSGRPTVGRRGSSSIQFAKGYVSDLRVTRGVARYTGATYTVPTAAFTASGVSATEAKIALPSPLGPFNSEVNSDLSDRSARILLPGPLEPFRAAANLDFTDLITDPTSRYELRITGSPELVIPMSSWQATLQTGAQQYLQCVVPAASSYLSDIAARRGSAQLVVYRKSLVGTQSVQREMARAPLSTIVISSGPNRETATISGYSPAYADVIPPGIKPMTGIRSTFQTLGGNARIRCDIDWFLRPGQTVSADGVTLVANYINYFVPSIGDSYMDVGSRG